MPTIWLSTLIVLLIATCRSSIKGTEYRGNVSISESDTPCQPWLDIRQYLNLNFADGAVELAGSYCRNPTADGLGPWCFVRNQTGVLVKEYCSISFCGRVYWFYWYLKDIWLLFGAAFWYSRFSVHIDVSARDTSATVHHAYNLKDKSNAILFCLFSPKQNFQELSWSSKYADILTAFVHHTILE